MSKLVNIIEYLEENETKEKSDIQHDRLLSDVNTYLEKIGLNNCHKVFREVKLVHDEDEIGRIDLAAINGNEVYIIEAKVIRGKKRKGSKTRGSISKQLRNYYNFFKINFNYAPRCIGVYRYGGAKKKFHHYEMSRPLQDLVMN
ncbi:NERD domain-containing protein [Nanoarchaeota archaeon]